MYKLSKFWQNLIIGTYLNIPHNKVYRDKRTEKGKFQGFIESKRRSKMFRTILNYILTLPSNLLSHDEEVNIQIPDYLVFDETGREDILKQVGLFEDFNSRKIKCPVCDDIVNEKNLRAIMPNKKRHDIICDNPLCYHEYLFTHQNNS